MIANGITERRSQLGCTSARHSMEIYSYHQGGVLYNLYAANASVILALIEYRHG